MNSAKKLLALFLCIAMPFSVTAFSACFNGVNTPPPQTDSEETPPADGEEDNEKDDEMSEGGNDGDNESGNEGDNGNEKPDVKSSVAYSEYGAAGDGKTDDFSAIKAAHEYANANGLSVRADDGACYYVGAHNDTVKIKTDTDWTGAQFIIDDTKVTIENRTHYVFEVSPEKNGYSVTVPSNYNIKAGQKQLANLSLQGSALLLVENSGKKDYIRYGANTNSGSTRQEMILVDKNGNVDESTPVLWDYDKVTKITAYSVTDKAVTVTGGTFTTKANVAEISASYYARGINVKRSNTTLKGIKHYVTGEGEHGSPYTGFFVVNNANGVTIEDCVLTGHKTYTNVKPTGTVQQGTYDTQAIRSNDITWLNCTQSNDITDTVYWGVMASNFCKNLKMEGCSLSRFDAHQGVYNATVKDTVLGQNLTIIGAGTLLIQNVRRTSGTYFMQLRADYGSTWQGDIIIKDCTFTPTDGSGQQATGYAIYAKWNDWNFGYTCYMPDTVTLDNFKVENGTKPCYIFHKITDETAEVIASSANPYVLTRKITILNEVSPLKLTTNSSGLLSGVQVER